jgi:hypothetical protein
VKLYQPLPIGCWNTTMGHVLSSQRPQAGRKGWSIANLSIEPGPEGPCLEKAHCLCMQGWGVCAFEEQSLWVWWCVTLRWQLFLGNGERKHAGRYSVEVTLTGRFLGIYPHGLYAAKNSSRGSLSVLWMKVGSYTGTEKPSLDMPQRVWWVA